MQRILLIGRGLMLGVSLLLGVAQAKAQVPGYMGHRFLVQANVELLPALVGITANNNQFFANNDLDIGAWGVSKYYSLTANYAKTRHRTVSMSLDYFKTGFKWKPQIPDAYSGLYTLQCYTLAVGGRYYKNIAPLGGYFEIAGEASYLKSDIKQFITEPTNTIPNNDDLHKGTIDLGLNLGWGYTNIINNHIIVDLGIKSHFSPMGLVEHIGSLSLPNDIIKAPLASAARVRKGYHSLLMFRIGLGYLF